MVIFFFSKGPFKRNSCIQKYSLQRFTDETANTALLVPMSTVFHQRTIPPAVNISCSPLIKKAILFVKDRKWEKTANILPAVQNKRVLRYASPQWSCKCTYMHAHRSAIHTARDYETSRMKHPATHQYFYKISTWVKKRAIYHEQTRENRNSPW